MDAQNKKMLSVGLPAKRSMDSCYCGSIGMWPISDTHLRWTPKQAPVYINGMVMRCCVCCQDKLQSLEIISLASVDRCEVWMRMQTAGRRENFSCFIMPAMMFYINTQVKAVELERSLSVHQYKGCTSDSCTCHFWPLSVVWSVKDVWLSKNAVYL